MASLNHQEHTASAFRMPLAQVKQAEEHRAYPRFTVNTSAAFRNGAGNRCKGQVVNISPDGLQVTCNLAAGQQLHPRGGRICEESAPIVQIALQLPLRNEMKKVVLGAQLVYATTRETDANCVLGFKFLELRPTAQRIIDNYFAEKMATYYEECSKVAVV